MEEIQEIQETQETQETNRGTGAGGAQTNINGLAYENQNDLSSRYEIVSEDASGIKTVKFDEHSGLLTTGKKSQFHKVMKQRTSEYNDIALLHGTKQPDQWFICLDKKLCFIIEIKYQNGSGSVSEKLQTPTKKLKRLKKMYPDFQILYIYGLSPWFRDNCVAEIEDLGEDNIPYFWGDDINFMDNIVNFILNQ
jgi:hypothetical protein